MHIKYANNNLSTLCTNLKEAKRKYPSKTAIKLLQTINFIEQASCLKTIIEYRPFRFHKLIGDRNNEYAIDIGPKKDGYRLIVRFDESVTDVFQNSIEITEMLVKEVGNHYEK